jgi:hypothetical protein
METTRLYLLVPHHDIPAGGPLVLGTIISDLRDPESLNEGAVVDIPPDSIHADHKYDWEETIEANVGANASVFARYLSPFLGGSVGGHWDTKSVIQYKFRDLETSFFSTSQHYVEKAVNKHKVQAYLEGSQFAPLYMITGLKIGRGPASQITSSKSYEREGHINPGFSTNVAGYPFAVDTGTVSVQKSGVKETSFRGSSDFVIAYRLVKITFHKKAGGTHVPKYEKYHVGALLDEEDDDEPNGEGKLALEVRVIGDVAVAEELQKEKLVTAIDEEDSLECVCFIIPPAEDQTT